MSNLLSHISGNECIICVQNSEFNRSLEVDLDNLISNNVTVFATVLDILEAGFLNESVQDIDVSPPTIDELRGIRAATLTEKKEVSKKLNHMAIRNDLIKAFQDIKINQIWKIFVINLCYNKYAQALNQKLIKVPLSLKILGSLLIYACNFRWYCSSKF